MKEPFTRGRRILTFNLGSSRVHLRTKVRLGLVISFQDGDPWMRGSLVLSGA